MTQTAPPKRPRGRPRRVSPKAGPRTPSALASLPELPTPPSPLDLASAIASGMALPLACSTLNISISAARSMMASEEWGSILKSALSPRSIVETRIESLVPRALEVKESILNDVEVNPSIRDSIASDILDRAGFSRIQKREVEVYIHSVTSQSVNAEVVRELAQGEENV